MEKKTIHSKDPSFMQSISIANQWCQDWENELLSEEVLADRISELIKTKNGLRGFFAYTLSDIDCALLDKMPTSLIYVLRAGGERIVEITVKNLIMSSAQIINHQNDNKMDYAERSSNISERCINLLRNLDTKLVTKLVKDNLNNLDHMSNDIDHSTKYNQHQKKFIIQKFKQIEH